MESAQWIGEQFRGEIEIYESLESGLRWPARFAAHVRTPGQHATAIPGLTLYRLLGIIIVGGLLLSQLLTPYTTPMVYLWFDRLAQSFAPHRIGNPIPQEGMTD